MLTKLDKKMRAAPLRLLFAYFLLPTVSLQAQGPPAVKALSDSTRRVVFDRGAFSGASTPLPQWDNGFLLSREIETSRAGESNVRVYDKSGVKVREAAIWFPGSKRLTIYSVAATSDGRIIAGGAADKLDGSVGPFIAFTDLSGKVTDVIQTNGFAPTNICQAPNGTIWSFGGTGYASHSEPKPGDTLRHFDFHQGQIGSYLPRSSFPKRPTPETLAYIRCSANEVVIYSTKAQEYIEMEYNGDSPHIYHAQVPSDLRLVGFAVTGPKKVYGYFSIRGEGGLYYLSFDEAANTVTWLPVRGTVGAYTTPGVITGLWGSDGSQLLVSRAADSAGNIALHWTTPIDQ